MVGFFPLDQVRPSASWLNLSSTYIRKYLLGCNDDMRIVVCANIMYGRNSEVDNCMKRMNKLLCDGVTLFL